MPGILVAKPNAWPAAWWEYTEDVLAPGTDGQVVVVDSTQPSGFGLADQAAASGASRAFVLMLSQ